MKISNNEAPPNLEYIERWEDQERANYSLEDLRTEFRARLYGHPKQWLITNDIIE